MPTLSERIASEAWPAIAGFGRWWAGELRTLVPSRLQVPMIGNARRADVRPTRASVEIVRIAKREGERFVEAKPLAEFDARGWAETASLLEGYRVRVLLKAPLIHVLTLRLPKAARPHLRSAIPLQLRDHAPLLPELLEWALVDTTTEDERLIVRVVIVRISTLEDIATGFLEHDLSMPPILAELGDGRPVHLRAGKRASGSPIASRPSWIAGAVLASTPLWMLGALHLAVLDQRSRVVDAEQTARPKLAAEKRLRGKAELADALKSVLGTAPVTTTIEDLAAQLPPNAHAVDISKTANGQFDLTLRTSDPDMTSGILAKDRTLRDLHKTGQTLAADGTQQLSYAASTR